MKILRPSTSPLLCKAILIAGCEGLGEGLSSEVMLSSGEPLELTSAESNLGDTGDDELGPEDAHPSIIDVGPEQPPTPIHKNPGSDVDKSSEPNRTTGRYPEVMWVKIVKKEGTGSCTGTVIAPYTVLTANHCMSDEHVVSVEWWGDMAFQAEKKYRNPYLYEAYTPAWWVTLNNAQKSGGGRQDDWPAQHDHIILFVPGLTPEVLRDRRITPAAIRADGGASSFAVVGVGSTLGTARDFMSTRFVPATPNSITVSRRDGYLSRDILSANFGNVDPGDSGGPSLGSFTYPWVSGPPIEVGRYIVGTTQNLGESGISPLAYDPGITMTENQRTTVRVNSLWAQARMDDPDGDGLPTACDLKPTIADPTKDNRCPAPIGGPSGFAIGDVPIAQLACKPGYVAVGFRGRSGDLIDRLGVQCRAFSCFGNADANCAGNSQNEYWSDEFGGTGGGSFSRSCPNGYMMVGVDATDNAAQGYVHSLAPRCAAYNKLTSSIGVATFQGPSAGNASWGASARRDCPSGEVMVGFQARSHITNFVTGLQPICSVEPVRYRWYLGGQGGGGNVLTCPAGHRAIGTVQNTHPDGAINAFGVLCGPNDVPGYLTQNSQITVVHGGFWHYVAWLQAPPAVEPLSSVHLPPGVVTSRCDGHLVGVQAHANSLVWSIDALRCTDGKTNSVYTKLVGVGTSSQGSARTQECPDSRPVDALYIRSGWLTDGFSVGCR